MSNPHSLDKFVDKPVDESMNVFRNPKLYPYIYAGDQSVCNINHIYFIILGIITSYITRVCDGKINEYKIQCYIRGIFFEVSLPMFTCKSTSV